MIESKIDSCTVESFQKTSEKLCPTRETNIYVCVFLATTSTASLMHCGLAVQESLNENVHFGKHVNFA